MTSQAKTQESSREGIVAFDCGTSGVKSALIVYERETDSLTPYKVFKTAQPTTESSGGLGRCWSPEGLIRDFCKQLFREVRRAEEEGVKILAIAPTTTTSSMVVLKNEMITSYPPPMRWDDRQAIQEARELEELRRATDGMDWLAPVSPDSGIAKAYFLLRNHHKSWMKKNAHQNTAHDDIVVLEKWSFLIWYLTRTFAQSESIVGRKWGRTKSTPWPSGFQQEVNDEVQQYLQENQLEVNPEDWLNETFLRGPLCSSGEQLGTIHYRIASQFGLPIRTPVVTVPYDSCAQVIGQGILSSPKSIAVTFGTSMGIMATTEKVPTVRKKDQKKARVAALPDALQKGSMLLFDGYSSCGSAIEFICSNHGMVNENGETDLLAVNRALNETSPGANGLMTLPFVNGGRRMGRQGEAVNAETVGSHVGTDNRHQVRALFEAFGYLIRVAVRDFQKKLPDECETLIVGGGPSNSEPFMQMLADITRLEVAVSSYSDSSLIGCAMCCAPLLKWAESIKDASIKFAAEPIIYRPNPSAVETYEKLFKAYFNKFHAQL